MPSTHQWVCLAPTPQYSMHPADVQLQPERALQRDKLPPLRPASESRLAGCMPAHNAATTMRKTSNRLFCMASCADTACAASGLCCRRPVLRRVVLRSWQLCWTFLHAAAWELQDSGPAGPAQHHNGVLVVPMLGRFAADASAHYTPVQLHAWRYRQTCLKWVRAICHWHATHAGQQEQVQITHQNKDPAHPQAAAVHLLQHAKLLHAAESPER